MCFDKDIVGVYWQLMTIADHYYYPHDHDCAHDLVADTIVKAIEARDHYDEKKSLLAWCRVIMRNTYYSLVTRKRHTLSIAEYDTIGGIDADQSVIIKDDLMCLMKLRHKSISADTLIDYSIGYSISEIARVKHLPVGTIKWRIHDARILLKKLLQT